MRIRAHEFGRVVTTAVFTLAAAFSGLACVTLAEPIRETFHRLGLPLSLALLVGAWKLLGAVALWLPGRALLREWAYAGFAFLFSGALVLHLAAGDSPAASSGPALLLALGAASYGLGRRAGGSGLRAEAGA